MRPCQGVEDHESAAAQRPFLNSCNRNAVIGFRHLAASLNAQLFMPARFSSIS